MLAVKTAIVYDSRNHTRLGPVGMSQNIVDFKELLVTCGERMGQHFLKECFGPHWNGLGKFFRGRVYEQEAKC